MTRSCKHLVVLAQTWVPFVIWADGRHQHSGEWWLWLLLTKVLRFITPALATLMRCSLRTMLEWFVAVSDIVEEMLKQRGMKQWVFLRHVDTHYLVFLCKEGSADTMDRCITPALRSICKNTEVINKCDTIPHSRIHPFHRGNQRTWNTLHPSKGPDFRFRSYSRLWKCI